MQLKVVVHKSSWGDYWAEVPAIPGCAVEGKSVEDVLAAVRAAVEKSLATVPVELCAHGEEIVELSL